MTTVKILKNICLKFGVGALMCTALAGATLNFLNTLHRKTDKRLKEKSDFICRNKSKLRTLGKQLESSHRNNSYQNIRQLRPRKAKINSFIPGEDQDSSNSDISDSFEELSLKVGVKRKKDRNSESGSEDYEALSAQLNTLEPLAAEGGISYLSSLTQGNTEYESEILIEPSPLVGKKRSIFTRRLHRSPANMFSDSDDAPSASKLASFKKGSQKRNNTQGSGRDNSNAPKRNLMQYREFENRNFCTEKKQPSIHVKVSNNQVSTSSKQHVNEMEQQGTLYNCTDQRHSKTATKKIKQKRKRIILLDSDSD